MIQRHSQLTERYVRVPTLQPPMNSDVYNPATHDPGTAHILPTNIIRSLHEPPSFDSGVSILHIAPNVSHAE